MTRAFLMVLVMIGAGCGDDTTVAPAADMTASADLSGGGAKTCGVDGISLSCAGVSGSANCFVCDYTTLTNGSGHCARLCPLAAPSCPTGQSCLPLATGDGGTVSAFAEEGVGCAGLGFCR